jgi:hypothetical protein
VEEEESSERGSTEFLKRRSPKEAELELEEEEEREREREHQFPQMLHLCFCYQVALTSSKTQQLLAFK